MTVCSSVAGSRAGGSIFDIVDQVVLWASLAPQRRESCAGGMAGAGSVNFLYIGLFLGFKKIGSHSLT
jgi:hypothetical protein